MNDPPTFPTLLTNTRHPYNAEGRLRNLTDSFITPVGHHYVRNHGLVPDIDPEEYTLTVAAGYGCKEKVRVATHSVKSFGATQRNSN